MMHKPRRKSVIGPVFGMLRPYWGRLALLLAVTVLQSVLQVAMAMQTQVVIDAALKNDGTVWAAGIHLGLILLSLIFLFVLTEWYTGSTIDHCLASLRQRLLKAAAYSEGEHLQAYHSGELLSRGMEDARLVCDGVVNALPNLAGQVTRLAGSFVAIWILYPPVAWVMLAAALVIGTMAACFRPIMKRQHHKVRQAETKVMANMQEDLQQLELIKSIGAEAPVLARFGGFVKKSLAVMRRRRLWVVSASAVFSILSLAGSGALLLWGALQVAAGAMSFGSLTSLLELLTLFRGPVLGISGLWTRLAGIEVAGERLLEMLEVRQAEEEVEKLEVHPKAIVFEDVTFRYPGEEKTVVENFSARFPLDGWACLTGVSGRGKTTLFKLILGLYSPQKGRIYLETEQGQIPCSRQTRHLFAYVPQDYALFSGTVLENLLLVAPEADEATRRATLTAAGADFVWTLTEAEQTQVRENNSGLSKGQLQRLAIARAILMDRPVFLLDECTSALDHETEDRVMENLSKMQKPAVLVTHRPEALENLPHVIRVQMDA